jgi:hypothetical protein
MKMYLKDEDYLKLSNSLYDEDAGFHSIDAFIIKINKMAADEKEAIMKRKVKFNVEGLCQMETLHLSCKSTPVSQWDKKDLAGLIVFSEGKQNGVKFRPGYVYIKSTEELKDIKSTEG